MYERIFKSSIDSTIRSESSYLHKRRSHRDNIDTYNALQTVLRMRLLHNEVMQVQMSII
jgi:hypothetical protein